MNIAQRGQNNALGKNKSRSGATPQLLMIKIANNYRATSAKKHAAQNKLHSGATAQLIIINIKNEYCATCAK